VRQLRLEQGALNEVEFEWLRQYYIQGARHARLNVWWRGPIQALGGHWEALETRTARALDALKIAAKGLDPNDGICISCICACVIV
jgi:alpha-ketoglutarate-dependent dioxygenase FTO